MGSSKRKASFRIDDILQQQQQQGAIRHLSGVVAAAAAAPSSPSPAAHHPAAHHQHTPLDYKTVAPSSLSPQSSPELVIDTSAASPMNSNQSSANKSDSGVSSHHGTSSTSNTTTVEQPYSSPSGSDGAPRKPHPVYPSFPDMQKHPNFYLPLGLSMPQFSPAAYLEHYANALQKGESTRFDKRNDLNGEFRRKSRDYANALQWFRI